MTTYIVQRARHPRAIRGGAFTGLVALTSALSAGCHFGDSYAVPAPFDLGTSDQRAPLADALMSDALMSDASSDALVDLFPEEVCGNGRVDPGELCDGASCPMLESCPMSTNDCQQRAVLGEAATCSAICSFVPKPCAHGDGCCPAGCFIAEDDDCEQAQFIDQCGEPVYREQLTSMSLVFSDLIPALDNADLDNDGRPDNQLGMHFGMGDWFRDSVSKPIAEGEYSLLLEFDSSDGASIEEDATLSLTRGMPRCFDAPTQDATNLYWRWAEQEEEREDLARIATFDTFFIISEPPLSISAYADRFALPLPGVEGAPPVITPARRVSLEATLRTNPMATLNPYLIQSYSDFRLSAQIQVQDYFTALQDHLTEHCDCYQNELFDLSVLDKPMCRADHLNGCDDPAAPPSPEDETRWAFCASMVYYCGVFVADFQSVTTHHISSSEPCTPDGSDGAIPCNATTLTLRARALGAHLVEPLAARP